MMNYIIRNNETSEVHVGTLEELFANNIKTSTEYTTINVLYQDKPCNADVTIKRQYEECIDKNDMYRGIVREYINSDKYSIYRLISKDVEIFENLINIEDSFSIVSDKGFYVESISMTNVLDSIYLVRSEDKMTISTPLFEIEVPIDEYESNDLSDEINIRRCVLYHILKTNVCKKLSHEHLFEI